MEFINKLETTVGGWVKNVPHLPASAQKWLGQNIWWIVLIGAILSGITLLFAIGALFTLIALLGAVTASVYGPYAAAGVTGLTIFAAVVSLAFLVIRVILMALAVKPLKALEKKGWVLLFLIWLLQAVSVVASAILNFSIVGFLTGIIFGAVGLAISGYLLFEIHGQFAHTVRSTKAKKTATKKA